MFYWLFNLKKKNEKLYIFCYVAISILIPSIVSIFLSVLINLVMK